MFFVVGFSLDLYWLKINKMNFKKNLVWYGSDVYVYVVRDKIFVSRGFEGGSFFLI